LAMAAPIPRPAPVTTAACPERAVSPMNIEPCPTDNYAKTVTLTNFSIKQSRALERTSLLKLKRIHIIPLTGKKFPPRWVEEVPSIPSRIPGAHRAETIRVLHSDSALAGTLKSVEFPGALGAME
jgi:hypothetical protein